MTRSALEDRFLAFLDAQRMPRPQTNQRVRLDGAHLEVDAVWPAHRLIAELDGHATDGTRLGFERDRERDLALQAVGWRVVRITWRRLDRDPGSLAAQLRAIIKL